jgi:hypothetical protein
MNETEHDADFRESVNFVPVAAAVCWTPMLLVATSV